MKNCNTILTEKQENISSIIWEIDKYEYLTGEEILPSDQKRVLVQAKFSYSPLGTALKEGTKTIEEQGKNNRCYY